MDLLLGLAKWPAALLAVLALPALVQALHYLQLGNLRVFAFAGGAFLYLALKIIAAARSNISMQIFFIFGAGWKEKYGRRGRHEERKALGASGELGDIADAAARRRGLGVSGVFRGGLAVA